MRADRMILWQEGWLAWLGAGEKRCRHKNKLLIDFTFHSVPSSGPLATLTEQNR